MNAAADRLQFAPPPQPGMLRAFILAVVAHLLLLLALTWGVNWKRDNRDISAEAELWSSVPVQAAPKLVEAPPPPPQPKVETPPPAPPPAQRNADIALEREKQKQADDKRRQEQLEQQKRLQAQREKEREEALKQELAKKAAEDKKKQDAVLKAKEQQEEAKRLEAQRQENLKRMAGLAGATGAPSATGTAQRSAGPSDSYGGRIRGRVKPNIVFTDDIPGNPVAEVEVRAAPDGTIVGVKVIKSSGQRSWDDAVVKALHKTEVLPRDIDGRVPSPIVISFRPKD